MMAAAASPEEARLEGADEEFPFARPFRETVVEFLNGSAVSTYRIPEPLSRSELDHLTTAVIPALQRNHEGILTFANAQNEGDPDRDVGVLLRTRALPDGRFEVAVRVSPLPPGFVAVLELPPVRTGTTTDRLPYTAFVEGLRDTVNPVPPAGLALMENTTVTPGEPGHMPVGSTTSDVESLRVEFKAGGGDKLAELVAYVVLAQLNSFSRPATATAGKVGSSRILLGVQNDGKVVGLKMESTGWTTFTDALHGKLARVFPWTHRVPVQVRLHSQEDVGVAVVEVLVPFPDCSVGGGTVFFVPDHLRALHHGQGGFLRCLSAVEVWWRTRQGVPDPLLHDLLTDAGRTKVFVSLTDGATAFLQRLKDGRQGLAGSRFVHNVDEASSLCNLLAYNRQHPVLVLAVGVHKDFNKSSSGWEKILAPFRALENASLCPVHVDDSEFGTLRFLRDWGWPTRAVAPLRGVFAVDALAGSNNNDHGNDGLLWLGSLRGMMPLRFQSRGQPDDSARLGCLERYAFHSTSIELIEQVVADGSVHPRKCVVDAAQHFADCRDKPILAGLLRASERASGLTTALVSTAHQLRLKGFATYWIGDGVPRLDDLDSAIRQYPNVVLVAEDAPLERLLQLATEVMGEGRRARIIVLHGAVGSRDGAFFVSPRLRLDGKPSEFLRVATALLEARTSRALREPDVSDADPDDLLRSLVDGREQPSDEKCHMHVLLGALHRQVQLGRVLGLAVEESRNLARVLAFRSAFVRSTSPYVWHRPRSASDVPPAFGPLLEVEVGLDHSGRVRLWSSLLGLSFLEVFLPGPSEGRDLRSRRLLETVEAFFGDARDMERTEGVGLLREVLTGNRSDGEQFSSLVARLFKSGCSGASVVTMLDELEEAYSRGQRHEDVRRLMMHLNVLRSRICRIQPPIDLPSMRKYAFAAMGVVEVPNDCSTLPESLDWAAAHNLVTALAHMGNMNDIRAADRLAKELVRRQNPDGYSVNVAMSDGIQRILDRLGPNPIGDKAADVKELREMQRHWPPDSFDVDHFVAKAPAASQRD